MPEVPFIALKKKNFEIYQKFLEEGLYKGRIYPAVRVKLHRDRLKEALNDRYDELSKQGHKIHVNDKNVELIPAKLLYPKSKLGEEKRDAYINAGIDAATRDLRTMVKSKVGPPPTYFDSTRFSQESLTVVEPGGLGYYQWQISKFFATEDIQGALELDLSKCIDDLAFRNFLKQEIKVESYDTIKYPDGLKKVIFTDVMKQELKGGIVTYDSDSLEAIQVIE